MALSCVSAFCVLPSAFAAVWLGVAVTGDRKWPMANGQLGEDSPANCAVARDLRSRFEVQGSRFKVRSMLDVRCWMFDVGCSMLDVRCWMFDVGCSMLDVRCWMFDVVPRLTPKAFGVPHLTDVRDFQAFAACSLGVV